MSDLIQGAGLGLLPFAFFFICFGFFNLQVAVGAAALALSGVLWFVGRLISINRIAAQREAEERAAQILAFPQNERPG